MTTTEIVAPEAVNKSNKNVEKITHLTHSSSITSVAEFGIENPEQCRNVSPKGPFANFFSNLCSASAGAKILFSTDDWFAAAENLLKDGPPQFVDDLYCEQGKVMDGWETRRRREEGHDWCLIQLSDRAQIHAIEIDTAHFTGNHVPKISIEIADLSSAELNNVVTKLPHALQRMVHGGVQGTGHTPKEVNVALSAVKAVEWRELLPVTELLPGFEPTRMQYFKLNHGMSGSLVRVNYYPDGGVARLRLWGECNGEEERPTKRLRLWDEGNGEVEPLKTKPLYMPIETGSVCTVVPHSSTDNPPSRQEFEYKELSSQDEGGIGVSCSNKHYGEPWLLTQKSLGKDMGDGWETARHPCRPGILHKDPKTDLIDSPLLDWAVLKLGKEAKSGAQRIILDTRHFRGNYPESVMLEGCNDPEDLGTAEWFALITRTRMSPDSEHVFDRSKGQISNCTAPFTHVRLSIFPDGGLSRVRIYG